MNAADPTYFNDPPQVERAQREPRESLAATPGGDALSRALGALGAPTETRRNDSPTDGEKPKDTPSFTPPPEAPKIRITAESLPALIEGVDKMVMQGIAIARCKGVPREYVVKAIQMPPEDKESLATLAPYAVKYADKFLVYAEPILAGVFVAMWGLSMAGRAKDLSALSKEYRAWKEAQNGNNGTSAGGDSARPAPAEAYSVGNAAAGSEAA